MKTAALIFILAVIGLVGYNDFKQDGLPSRAWVHTIAEPAKQFSLPYHEVAAVSAPTVMLVGDSHGGALESGLVTALANTGETFASQWHAGCPPLFDTFRILPFGHRKRCHDGAVNRSLAVAAETASVRTVIITSRGPVYVTGKRYGDVDVGFVDPVTILRTDQPTSSAGAASVYESALRDTLARFVASGKRVIFVLDNAELGFNPKTCFAVPLRFYRVRTPCAVSRQDFDARNQEYRAIVARVLQDFPKVQAFDAAAPFCDAQWCWAMKDGQMLYHDDNHLSVAGSEIVAKAMLPLILQK